jgi:hypothetical protein
MKGGPMSVVTMPLPSYRYIPGENARPDQALFDAVKELAPAVTLSATAADNVAWRYGMRLLNTGYYWEAHEVLERVWINAAPNSRERHLVRAVIHLANGMLKEIMGRPNARRRLAGLSRSAFAAAFRDGRGVLMGIESAAALQVASDLAVDKAPLRIAVFNEI